MKKIINGYEIIPCTAIAVDVDNSRQPALFIHKLDDENRDGDSVVFGWDIDYLDGEASFEAMCEDYSAWDRDYETLQTVLFQGKMTISEARQEGLI